MAMGSFRCRLGFDIGVKKISSLALSY